MHAKRPLGCRGWNSRSAELCRESVETGNDDVNITAVGEIVLISGAVRSGVEAGLEQHQLFSDLVELTAALVIALEHPDAAERIWPANDSSSRPGDVGAVRPLRPRARGWLDVAEARLVLARAI